MKKSLKLIALGLAVVPCSLMLTACNGNGDLVDISGNYTKVETTDYSAIVDEVDAGFNLQEAAKGLKLMLTIEASADLGDMGTIYLNMKNDVIAKANPVDGAISLTDIEAYNSTSADMKWTFGLEGQQESIDYSLGTKQYIVNGTQYVDFSEAGEILSTLPGESMPTKYYQVLATAETAPVVIPDYNLSSLLEMVPEGNWGEKFEISKSETETGFKVKFVATKDVLNDAMASLNLNGFTLEFTDKAELYMIYENNEFSGLNLNVAAKVVVNLPQDNSFAALIGKQLTLNLNLNAQCVGFNGEIEYPSDLATSYLPIESLMG